MLSFLFISVNMSLLFLLFVLYIFGHFSSVSYSKMYIYIYILQPNGLKAIHLAISIHLICLLCKLHIMFHKFSCTIHLYFMYELHCIKVQYVKRHRAKFSTPFPSNTCIIDSWDANNSHPPDGLAYLLSSH